MRIRLSWRGWMCVIGTLVALLISILMVAVAHAQSGGYHWVESTPPVVVHAMVSDIGKVYVIRPDASVVTCPGSGEFGMFLRIEKRGAGTSFEYVLPDPKVGKGQPVTINSTVDRPISVACLKVH